MRKLNYFLRSTPHHAQLILCQRHTLQSPQYKCQHQFGTVDCRWIRGRVKTDKKDFKKRFSAQNRHCLRPSTATMHRRHSTRNHCGSAPPRSPRQSDCETRGDWRCKSMAARVWLMWVFGVYYVGNKGFFDFNQGSALWVNTRLNLNLWRVLIEHKVNSCS